MLTSAKGNLTMVGLNTVDFSIFWSGQKLNYAVGVRADADEFGSRIRVEVADTLLTQASVYAEMQAQGIAIKHMKG
jgi:hypothetical protein